MKKKNFPRKIFFFAALGILTALVAALGYALVNRFFINPPVDARIEDASLRLTPGEVIQINVLNASGEQKLARKVMDYLRARKFDVVEIANFPTIEERSFVIDRLGDTVSARKVAYAVGIADSLVQTQIDSSLYLRCSVILGRDYQQLKPFQ